MVVSRRASQIRMAATSAFSFAIFPHNAREDAAEFEYDYILHRIVHLYVCASARILVFALLPSSGRLFMEMS